MPNNYVKISNTGSSASGAFVLVEDWKKSQPEFESFRGLDKSITMNIGADNGKWIFEGTLLAKKVDTTGWASLEGAGQTVATWANSTVATERLLTLVDPDGTQYSTVWVSGYAPEPITNGVNGNSEYFRVKVRMLEQ